MLEIKAIHNLTECLAKLPSIGKKSAERLAYAMIDMDEEELNLFADAIKKIKTSIHRCKKCGMYCEDEECEICQDEERDQTTLMIVSYPKDVLAFEKSNGYHGLYHVLYGAISTSKGISFDDLNVNSLINRLNQGNIKEVIIATNPNVDGETTALYLAKKLEKYDLKITRLAYGLQMGSALDYTDSLTLDMALKGRHKIGE